MNWQDMIGGVVNKPTRTEASPEKNEGQEAGGQASGGLLGSVIGTAFTSLGGTGRAEKLNSVTSFLSPELKADLVGSALNKIGASGADLQALLSQLGINPAIADNPEEATPEELARLEEQEFSDDTTDVHEQATKRRLADHAANGDAGNKAENGEEG